MIQLLLNKIREAYDYGVKLDAKITNLEAVVERMHRKGTVMDVDAKNQLYRQQIGLNDDGNPVPSPWIPYNQIAGALKVHSPPSVGQQMLMVSPDGDHEQAFGMPLTFSTDNASPSQDPGTDMSVRGKSSDTQTKDGRTFTVGGASIAITDGKVVITAADIELVGSIKLGSSDASRPLALKDSIDTRGDAQTGNLATKVTAI